MPDLTWKKSSYSGSSGCLEVVRSAGFALIRDSTDPDKVLVAAAADWEAFIAGIKAGEFDHAVSSPNAKPNGRRGLGRR